ncbi:hypothetical protein LTR70_008329 [Exophiala xenobiotica]|uniref:Uncharacterized protein n=1 Tax=Lithohypha guttulata TaxID=1690604 RepID=A0ABR0K348_9EURO|nr:hypothetical protein LTR24_007907 [Lithohypha guttulata]KAK5312232.1 hypothetical protein LTR70_008329 [Exophiala xenobiotica]
MWPLWLIIVVAASSAVTLTVTGVLVAVYAERKRHRKLIAQHGVDRNVSQYHRPHLSINDVDFAALPRPTRSLRQSIVSPRRDSRFYSTMPSEAEIKTFPDGSAESVAEASFVHTDTGADQSHQWLNPSKSGKRDKRKKKAPVFSISAPMAKSPLSVVTEMTEAERAGSPEPVELPTHTTPTVTPEKLVDHQHNPMPSHAPHGSVDSIVSGTDKHHHRVSQRISHGNAIKSRSISMGSIHAPPPGCPLPPVPEGMPNGHLRNKSHPRVVSEIDTEHRDISLLNTPLSPVSDNTNESPNPKNVQLKARNVFSGFNFGLGDGTIQVITVEPEQSPRDTRHHSDFHNAPRFASSATTTYTAEESFKTIDASAWNLSRGLRHLGPSTPNMSSNSSEAGSRPVSAISLHAYNGANTSTTPNRSPSKVSFNPPSRPVSVSSVDIFRNSIVGPNAPVLAPESPRSRGHKRQNCVRISGLTPVDASKKRLSSQLRRLSEAEEADQDGSKTTPVELPTRSPTRRVAVAAEEPVSVPALDVPKLRQPQTLSLRIKRPGVHSIRDKQTGCPPPLDTNISHLNQQPRMNPLNQSQEPLSRSKTTEPQFVYQGSPASDPTKPPPPKQEYSPASPTPLTLTPEKKQPQRLSQITYPPASASMLDSPVTRSTSPRRVQTQLHGPRTLPAASLRTRNRTSPVVRQGERSGSPIRKTSASNAIRQRSTSQDDVKRSLTLLKTLTHAAQSSAGLPEVNIVKKGAADRPVDAIARTPSSRYTDSPALPAPAPRPRQRAKTVDGRAPPSMFDPPRLRPEVTFPPPPQQQQTRDVPPASSRFPYSPSNISIYEDTSVKGSSPTLSFKPAPSAPTTRRRAHSRPQQPLEKEGLRKLPQNTDTMTSRALALGGNSPKSNDGGIPRDRKVSKVVDGYWGACPQTQIPTSDDLAKIRENISAVPGHSTSHSTAIATSRQNAGSTVSNARDGWANATATGYGAPGPRSRQRSHTVAASARPVNGNGHGTETGMKEGVGLGVDFGRTGLGTTFLNEMERDGIGRLR